MKSSSDCRLFTRSVPVTLAIWLACAASVGAFNAPADRIGPLTVHIVGPETVTRLDTALDVRVTIENQADGPVTGSVRLGLIDGWRSEPADAVPFTVAAKSTTTCDFRVAVAPGSYSAHYPIHAYATFPWDGQQRTAHPILVLTTNLPTRPASIAAPAWEPLPLTSDRTLALLQVPVRRAVVAVFGQPPQVMPVGWTGAAEGHRSSIQLQNALRLGDLAHDVLGIHPPWFDGQVGTAWVEYPFLLPQVTPIQLRFATAVTPTGDGDGVTYRVRVAAWDAPEGESGETIFERHSAAKKWEEGEADLSGYAGRKVRIQLESHPGPAKNTAFDQSYWAEPTLVLGRPPQPQVTFPPAKLDGAWRLGQVRVGDSSYEVRVWPGQRGLLDATIGFLNADRPFYFHGFRVRVLGMRIDDPGSPVALREVKSEPRPGGGYDTRHRFQSPHGAFDLVGRVELKGETLRVGFQLENAPPAQPWFAPHIEDLAVHQFSHVAQRVYAGHGNVIHQPGAFSLGFDGHRLATSHVGFEFANGAALVQAVDLPPDHLDIDPATRHYSLHAAHNATFTFVPSRNIWEAAKQYRSVNGLRAAGGVERLAGRFVFDLWGGHYGPSRELLRRAFRYGLTDSAVVWHNWQRWGYDYRLPEIYPPNPELGTEEELRRMISDCREAGVLFALHDNYIDMYPDAEGFSYHREIAFHADGRPIRAWNNESRAAQSYRFRADRVANYLQPNLKTIKGRLQPSAYFIDVWSSIQPYDYWTADGRFVDCVATRDSWARHFAWIRDLLGDGAPQISESGHDQLIGSLDGAQTNHLRVGPPLPGDHSWSVWNIPCEDAERTPWFDFAHHDRFILHGAGYSNRYQAGLDARRHGIYSDDYLATEVLTGHPTMVSEAFGRDVVRKYWLTHDLMRALALRTMETVEFVDGDLHRQHVRWSGGGDVWVNRGNKDWQIIGEAQPLPQYGFQARVGTPAGPVTASVSRREGVIVEEAGSADHLYFHGRQNPDGKSIDFGPVRTSGGCRLIRQDKSLLLIPLPDSGNARTRFEIRWDRLPWSLPNPKMIEPLTEDGRTLNRLPVGADGVVIECQPNVFAYRLLGE